MSSQWNVEEYRGPDDGKILLLLRLFHSPMSASKGLSAPSEKAWNSLLFNLPTVHPSAGKGNAFCLRHVGDARHVGDGRVFPVFVYIRNNWVGASQ